MPAVETLRRVWVQQYMYVEGAVRWRDADSTPPSALMISSPYDTEAHYARKRSTSWIGYKVHLTETCEEQTPHLITHVETADAPAGDSDAVSPIHEALAAKDLLPSTQLVDTGYVEAKLLVQIRRDYDVDLYGQTRSDYHWQSQAGHGFDAGSFLIDWGKQQATCPEGKKSLSWTPTVDRGDNEVIKIKFSRVDCRPCPSRALCTTTKHLRRTITIRTQAAYEALQAARRRQETDEFQEQYRERAGVEGTISQAVRANGDEALALRRISQDASAARADRRRVECGSHQRLVSWGATGGNTNISLRTDDCVVRAGVEAFATSIECAGEPRKSKQLFSITIPCAHRPAEAGRLGHRRAPMSEATSAVQPVWWLAPRPCPVSP